VLNATFSHISAISWRSVLVEEEAANPFSNISAISWRPILVVEEAGVPSSISAISW